MVSCKYSALSILLVIVLVLVLLMTVTLLVVYCKLRILNAGMCLYIMV